MRLSLRDHELGFRRGWPKLMGIVNAGPDSFSDPGPRQLQGLFEAADQLIGDGAALVDVGGVSGRTDRPAVSDDEEIRRIVPLVELLVARGALVSVDTWRAGPARAALEAGAAMINDPSGLTEPAIADLCAEHRAALVITHTRARPKMKEFPEYGDVVADVTEFLADKIEAATARGVAPDSLLLDPGLDLGKQVGESVEVLQRLDELEGLGRPLLLAISRKDFVGAATFRRPAERDAGTLGAIEPAMELPGAVLRMHDVGGAMDFLRMRRTLRGETTELGAPMLVRLPRRLQREGADA